MKTNYTVLQDSVKQKEARIIFLRNNIQMLHHELEHLESMDSVKEVQQLRYKIESLERVNTELQLQLNVIIKNKNKNKNKNENKNKKLNKKVTDLTNDDLKNWWRGLTNEWQMAFNQVFFTRGEVTNLPSPEELKSLLATEKIEIIGERILFGGFKRLTFKLSDFSGLTELQFIESVNLSGHNISNTNGLNHLNHLKVLNLTGNNLTQIGYSAAFKSVTSLIVRDNLLANLEGLEIFENLEFLDISDNANLVSLSVLDKLEKLAVLRIGFAPNLKKQIVRLKMMQPNIEVRDS
jgi:hypothetical protein